MAINVQNIERFKFIAHKIIPLVYDDSLSYYEFLCKVMQKLNEVISSIENQNEILEEFDEEITEWETSTDNKYNQFVSNINALFEAFKQGEVAARTAFMESLANTYSNAKTYSIGDYVRHEESLYRCIIQISTPESWNDEHWEEVVYTDDLYKQLGLYKVYVTPEMFGAVGDGVADDTNALQMAINSESNVICTKQYAITETLNITNGTSIYCESGGCILAKEELENMLYLNRTEITKPQIISVTLDGKGKANCGIYIQYAANVKLINIRTRDFLTTHININGGYEVFCNNIYCRNNLPYESVENLIGIRLHTTDSKLEECVTVNCPIGFDLGANCSCNHLHPWNTDEDIIANSVGINISGGIAHITNSEIDTCAIGVKQTDWYTAFLTNVSFISPSDFEITPTYIVNPYTTIFCSNCVFGNAGQSGYILATQEMNLSLSTCVFDTNPDTTSKYKNIIPFGTTMFRLNIVNSDDTGISIPANSSKTLTYNISGIKSADFIAFTVMFDTNPNLCYKLVPEINTIKVIISNISSNNQTLYWSNLNCVLFRNNGDTIFTYTIYNPSES